MKSCSGPAVRRHEYYPGIRIGIAAGIKIAAQSNYMYMQNGRRDSETYLYQQNI